MQMKALILLAMLTANFHARLSMAAEKLSVIVNTSKEPIAIGPYTADWKSLEDQYKTPDWFRDAKFGIWAHWSAQCVPEHGDWYPRNMYLEGNDDWKFEIANYGHPSKRGFKEHDHEWHAENWDPEKLMDLSIERPNGPRAKTTQLISVFANLLSNQAARFSRGSRKGWESEGGKSALGLMGVFPPSKSKTVSGTPLA